MKVINRSSRLGQIGDESHLSMTGDGKINVMHTVLSLVVGGLERLVVDSLPLMRQAGMNVEVCCFDQYGAFAERLQSKGIPVTLLKKNPNHYDAIYPIRLGRFLRLKRVHVLHMHSGTFFLGTQAGVLARTPAMIYTEHGRGTDESAIRRLEDRLSTIFVDKVVAVSNELERYLAETVRLPRRKIMTIINGIDTDRFAWRPKPTNALTELSIPLDYNVVGTVGRIDRVKNQASLIRAFKIVKTAIPNTVLLLVGDGPLRSRLEELVREQGLDGAVKFCGYRPDVPDMLNLFDVFVLSSISEGTCLSLLEAMASGVAPVVTDVGGNPSIVDNGIDGLVVPPGDESELAAAILQLLRDPQKRHAYGQNAMRKVKRNYGISSMVDRYCSLYREILAKRRRTRHLVA